MEVPGLPLVRAVDRGGNDRNLLLHGDHPCTWLNRAWNSRPLSRALDEETERIAVAHDLTHPPHRFAIGLSAPNRDRPEAADQLAEPRDPMRLDLGEEVHRAR